MDTPSTAKRSTLYSMQCESVLLGNLLACLLDPIDRMSEFLIFGRFFLQEISPFVSIFLPTKFNLNVPQRICLSAPLKEMEISYFSILHFFTEYRSHNFCTKFPPRISKRHRAASYLISLLVCFGNSWHWKFIKRLSWFHFQQLPLANEAHNLSTTVIILRPVSNFWLLANCDIELHQWCHAPDCWKLFFYSFG